MSALVLRDIYLYPIKSLSGIRVKTWPVVATGLLYDRQWMLIDKENTFLSQRRLPKMALIKTAINGNQIILSAPGMPDFLLDLLPDINNLAHTITSAIWHDQVKTIAISAAADRWFSQFLQIECRLVYQPPSSVRRVNPDYAHANDQTALSDGFPFLLLSDASLHALNAAMNLDLSMARFRPNLVVTGCDSYAEDTWRQITIGPIGFRLPKPCSRCAITTVDPNTGECGKEPLTTLNRLRKWQNKVYFGQNAIHDGIGQLQVGDPITINITGPKQPPL